jgi:DNA-binding Lrp family transcriptional regulator
MENDYKNIVSIKFAQAQQPKFEEKKGKGFIEFGENNNYPEYLLSLYNESPKHGAIVKGKANYIFGKGFEGIPVTANSRGESFNTLAKKCILDDEIFGGFYLQVIFNKLGALTDIFHLEYYKVRTNKEESEFKVKDDWSNNKEEARCYPSFDSKKYLEHPTQIIFIKQYNPKANVYPLPNYFQALNYIESDVQVSRHILGNAKDGFSATTLISLNGGEPQEEQKAATERGLKKKFTGSEGDKMVIMFNKSKDNEATIQPLSQTMLTKEDFTNVNNLIQQEIFAGHQVTSPMLFGIKTEGQLGGRSEIMEAYEIFNNTYVNERQQAHEETFNTLLQYKGVKQQFKIGPVEPLGFTIKDDLLLEVLPREYFLDKMSVDQKYYSLPPAVAKSLPADTNAMPSGMTGMDVNSHLKGMSGRNFQHLDRIVNRYKKGKLSKEQATMLLRNSFGLSDEDITVMLTQNSEDQQFALQEEVDFALLEQFSQVGERREEFEILSKKPARESEYFADVKTLSELQSNILNLIRKDKRITPEVIAQTINQDVAVVARIMRGFEDSGVITTTNTIQGEDTIVERVATDIKIDSPRANTTDILLRYSYEGPKDSRNRDFCAKMLDLNRLYSRSDIERISERLGYSVWDRRGGWFTQPDGEHRPYCRHEWFALTVTRKK